MKWPAVLLSALVLSLSGAVHHAGARTQGDPPPPKEANAPLRFQRLIVNTGGERAQACLRFDQEMDRRAEAHYGDYLRVSPAIAPALHAQGRDLCLDGLAYGKRYDVTLLKGLPSASGRRMPADQAVRIETADRNPMVSISGNGIILPRQTASGLAIQTVNVDRLRIHVLRMGDKLLSSRPNEVAAPSQAMDGYTIRSLLADRASVVWSGTMDVRKQPNRTVETAFPLDQAIRGKGPGAYLVVAEDAGSPVPSQAFAPEPADRDQDLDDDKPLAGHWAIVTDMALTTFSGTDGLHVLARSLATAKPLAGARISLIAAGQDVLGAAETDAEGQAIFPAGLLRGKGAMQARTVTAYGRDGDFTLLSLDRPAFDLSDRGVSGLPAPGPVMAFLATERGIYRPGETVNVTALVRDRRGMGFDTPLTLILRRPDGVQARRYDLQAGQADGFHQAFALSPTAARGQWMIEARIDPSGAPIGRVGIDVQDFVPQQLKVTLSAANTDLTPGGKLSFTVDGRFLYGAPAAGLHGEATLRIVRDTEPVPAARDYRFGLADEEVHDEERKIAVPDADASGRSRVSGTFEAPDATSAPLKAILTAGFFEPTGRFVPDQVALPIRNQARLIGVRPHVGGGAGAFGGDTSASFDVRSFGRAGQPEAAGGLHWTVIRENRVYDWFSTGGTWSFHYHTVDEPVGSGTVDAPADGPAVVTRNLPWGHYRFAVNDPATGAASSARFDIGWAEPPGDTDAPDKAEVAAEAPSLAVGQTTRVHVQGPFGGHAEIVIANDRVLETRSLEVPKDGADFEVRADPAWGPGAYVMVSVYRPLADPARPHDPVRAVGLTYIPVDQGAHVLSVALSAPERTTPRHALTVPVHVSGGTPGQPAYVTLAAVDEGILQLTRFASPDPAAFLFGKRRLGVEMRDDYGRLLDGSAPAGAIREGGDAGIGGPGLPVTSTRIVSLFSGPVVLDAKGDARISVAVPDFEGQLRLMAVAWSRDAVGSASGRVTVRDPVFAEVALPRFLAPGDHARIAVSLVDNDGPDGAYHLDVTTSGPARIEAGQRIDAAMTRGERRQFAVELTGLDAGVATVSAGLTGPDGFRQHRDWQIAIRPAHYPVTLAQTAMQAPGETFRLDPRQLDSFVPGSVTVSVGYAGYAGLDASSLLQSLYTYPFGCTEQLVSTAWPLIYFNDPGLLGRVPRDGGAKAKVQRAVGTILDREDPAGRFGLWRAGDGQGSPWLDAYAVDFLMHARESGFDVPDEALNRALRWLGQDVSQTGEEVDGHFRRRDDETRAYGWYVLARAGRPDLGAMRRGHDTLSRTGPNHDASAPVAWADRTDDPAQPLALGHLAGALALMQDHARAHDTFRMAVANLGAARAGRSSWFDRTYWSYVRDLAGLVAIAADSGEDDIAQSLIGRFGKLDLAAPLLNTQEKAMLLAAAHAMNRDEPGRAVMVNGRRVDPLGLPAGFSPDAAEVKAGFTVENVGSRKLWRTVMLAGAPAEALPPLQAGYELRRRELTPDGKPVDVSQLRQNDRFLVVLDGRVGDDADHRTVLVDMLPAGWEIEGKVTSEDQYAFLGALSAPRVAEARDDRFVAAFDLGPGLNPRAGEISDDKPAHEPLGIKEFRVAYIVRVATPGRFARPEAVVSDMYRPQVMARTAAGTTTAAPR